MSATGDEEIPGREVAYRLFAAEYDDASLSHTESDEERAPNYVVAPTGARLNRVFVVGTLTEVSPVNDEMVRARVVDPTGAFVVYAGQYQPDELAALEQIDPPAFVAVTGKARTFEPEDGDRIYTSIRPESIATVDADTRERWVISTAEQTIARIGIYAAAAELEAGGVELTAALEEAGVDPALAAGIPLAQDHYGTTPDYLAALRDCGTDAVSVVAGDRREVGSLELAPDEGSGETPFSALADLASVELTDGETIETDDTAESIAATTGTESTASSDPESAVGTASPSDRESTADPTDFDTSFESESSDDAPVSVEESATEEPEGVATESTVEEDEPVATESDDDLGDFEAGTTTSSETAVADQETNSVDSEPTVADPETDTADPEMGDEVDAGEGMYEMDDEEREQLEAEFGAEFTTGTEVDEPGEADIDVPEPEADVDAELGEAADAEEPIDEPVGATDADEPTDLESAPTSSLEPEAESSSSEGESTDDIEAESAEIDEPAEDVDLQSSVVEKMAELDDGDGADRETVIETVADETGASTADVEDAIEDALMGGRCYEPGDGLLKAI